MRGPERWDLLFRDLEAEFDAAEAAELEAEVAERVRRESARLRLVDRLRAARGCEVVLRLGPELVAQGRVLDAGPDWTLLEAADTAQLLVPGQAVSAVGGLGRVVEEPGSAGQVEDRLDLRFALRALARARRPLALWLRSGATLNGVLLRVGADFVDVRTGAAGDVRAAAGAGDVLAVPLAELRLLRSG